MHPEHSGASACFFFVGRPRRAQNDAALMEFFVTLYSVKEKVPQFVSIAQRIWYDELEEIKKAVPVFIRQKAAWAAALPRKTVPLKRSGGPPGRRAGRGEFHEPFVCTASADGGPVRPGSGAAVRLRAGRSPFRECGPAAPKPRRCFRAGGRRLQPSGRCQQPEPGLRQLPPREGAAPRGVAGAAGWAGGVPHRGRKRVCAEKLAAGRPRPVCGVGHAEL